MARTRRGLDYFDPQFHLPAVKLLPGDFVATHADSLLVTVLGSCVAACLRDPVVGVCGMNHFMLPQSSSVTTSDSLSARFGVQAMELLITEMQKRGARRDRLQAKVFGAGKVLDGMNVVNVGELNADFVRRYLDLERIPIIASDLLGDSARKVYFFTDSGKVMIRRLNTAKVAKLVLRERQYRERIAGADWQGGIDLF
ncbi:MAG: chemoreceptor glutamine deamidase CheD [Paludibacterium sp.]|uniref:chemoreceptor glutamine deamidase CheD n=1 Tax=Paludibacterium sp. TaxID=1917523 RepID=UPI0025F25E81|nr:chemoreceptor glutamine deamidase CheD [Paludibacterium sp.]MBV8047513.1 chemoreceptor glutamine deamidase CheD [Paludibacterium sp.]MBV8648367.1 chemoreceptor glutamine deamidase CheD [Paludibacterium sp.]